MKQPHILIIEDDEDILELEEYHLQKEGYEVTGILSPKKLYELLDQESIDLLIVDRNLGSSEGSEVVEQLRKDGYSIPVIFVSAKARSDQIEEGFLRGGDDYLVKPFNMNELLLRVRSLLKRAGSCLSPVVVHKEISLNIQTREVVIDNLDISLSRLEFDLLHYFMLNAKRAINRDELLEEVWRSECEKLAKTVNVAINRLQKKIDPDRSKGYIQAIRGIGYMFE